MPSLNAITSGPHAGRDLTKTAFVAQIRNGRWVKVTEYVSY